MEELMSNVREAIEGCLSVQPSIDSALPGDQILEIAV
jgi:predicted RNase H-like HicB family nuclease